MVSTGFQIRDYTVGAGQPLLIIAGPCVLEEGGIPLQIALQLSDLCRRRGLPLIFKASFDKANRTSGAAYRGPGLDAGLRLLEAIGREAGVPVTTDIHESQQAAAAAEVCELLQIPAFLARQTDLLLAAGRTGKAVNVKKGQFMAPWDMRHPVEKLRSAGCSRILLCERGTFFGYGRLVNDMRALVEMRALDCPVVFDATHSVQEPSGLGASTGGNRAMVRPLARAAAAVGIDGLFFETHPDPDRSPSDGPNMVPLSDVGPFLDEIMRVREIVS
jgi:2-dehydro-3-deoxyphosphooctonate aldolase (KDO 8-P synthase)